MSDKYLYGAYGHIDNTVAEEATQANFAAIYVGTAPVNLIRGYASKKLVNEPVKLSNITAKNVIGYSNDWNSFTLSEVISAHFDNTKGNIGPVYVINVLDPEKHKKDSEEHSVTFVNREAKIESDTIIIDTFAIEEKVEGVDYELSYNFSTGKLTITSIGSTKLEGQVACTYEEVDPSKITEAVFQGAKKDGVYTGAHVIEKLYPFYGIVPQYVAAPGFTDNPANYEMICDLCYQINNHWFGFVYADLPILAGSEKVDTFDKAKSFRKNNNYFKANSKIYWPMSGINGKGNYHLSTLAVVEKMRADMKQAGHHPCQTDGNKTVPISYQYFGEGSSNGGFDQEDGNVLAKDGISTVVAWGGTFQLWGDHTAAFTFEQKDAIDQRLYFDVNVIMLNYTLNKFQSEHGKKIDDNITKAMIQTITHDFNEWLLSLVTDGALVGNPKVMFLEDNNATAEMAEGHFVWNVLQTNAPLFKVAECYASYTTAGISEFFAEEE